MKAFYQEFSIMFTLIQFRSIIYTIYHIFTLQFVLLYYIYKWNQSKTRTLN